MLQVSILQMENHKIQGYISQKEDDIYMLEFKRIKNSNKKIALLKEFDIDLGFWIVPHIQIKYDLQNFYINSHKNLIGDPFKTISEFQEEILLSCRPELQIVSENIIQTFIKNELNASQERRYHFSGSVHIIFRLLSHLLPIFSHIEGPELLSQLIQENAVIKRKWGRHLLEAMKIWKKLKDQFIIHSWISSVLVHRENPPVYHKMIVVDMGCDLLTAEMEMFERLAKDNHVVIVHPDPLWFQKYPNEFFAYNHQKAISPSSYSHKDDLFENNIINRRFVSMLAEVKDAVGTVRKWIDQGIDPSKIVISAPSIKTYMSVLKKYLDIENIPYNQSFITEVHSLPDIAMWISKIQLQLKPEVQPYALELAVFGNHHKDTISHKDFYHIYGHILDTEDYKRSEIIYNNFISKTPLLKDAKLSAFDFLNYVYQFWDNNSSEKSIEGFTQILSVFIKNTKRLPRLKASDWLEILESIVSKTNISSSSPSFEGIYLSDLSMTDHLFAQKIYMMGLSEQGLKGERSSLLNNLDISSINNQLGFFLEPVEKSPLEFYTDWILSNPSLDKVISFSETDFIGEVLTPSILWLRNQKEIKHPQIPSTNQIDQIQADHLRIANTLLKSNKNSQKTINATLKNILQDKALINTNSKLSYNPPSLSVGALENYYKCPFIFYVENVLKIKSLITLNMDMNPLTQGSLIHALLSDLTKEPFCSDWTDQQLDDLIEDHLVKENILFGEAEFKTSFKEIQIKKLQEFLQFERSWRKEFPKTQTILREAKIQAYIDSEGQISPQSFKGAILIKGRLDRLDKVGDSAFSIIDYKLSLSSKTNYKTWIKNGDLQLGLYALMVKSGCLEDVSGDVASVVYFGMKEMKRDKGFLLEEYNGFAHNINSHHHKMNVNQQKDFFSILQSEIGQIISSIMKGDFSPHPRDKNLCQKCHWRNICKAPHLI